MTTLARDYELALDAPPELLAIPRDSPGPLRRLRPYRHLLVAIGLIHTLLCAGTVFGWSSLEALLRAEGRFGPEPDRLFAMVFTCGAVGNYISNLPFGVILDRKGPKFLGVLASLLYGAAVACAAQGCATGSAAFLAIGVFGIGFAGPAVQLPTLCLACLFDDGAAAMSLQAAAFDGGAIVFAVARELADERLVTAASFLRWFLLARRGVRDFSTPPGGLGGVEPGAPLHLRHRARVLAARHARAA
eukprot:CAMPEP_0119270392 /NCGR_PEP_ID=MMETSP1329-20130426/7411_1 /TAXON_ID=114041 /ORGANISM="Genus nov. species nov., Strain RCC1024" /LENGTH=245 /DNA_ID=CAMNT_0007270411 /DNA_START=51 /DNA_END=785 /DNA_ORIENTATION=+